MFYLNRKVTLLTCAILIALISVLGTVANVRAEVPDAVVAAPLLRLRNAPNSHADALVDLPNGTQLTLSGRNADTNWLYGRTNDTGALGWVSKAYLSIRLSLDVWSLPQLGADAPTSTGGSPAVQQPAPANNTTNTTTNTNTSNTANNTTTTTTNTGDYTPSDVSAAATKGRFEIGGHVAGLDGTAVDAMRRAHMKWAKFQVAVGDGSGYAFIQSAHANGFKVLLGVKGDKNRVTDPNFWNEYAGYVGSLAAQGVDAIEVWNEMNIDREWPTGQINPALYVQLLAKAYAAIKANNRNTMVITGALAPTGAEGAFGLDRVWNDDRYTAGMAKAGASRYADCIGVHYNEGIVPPTQSRNDPRGDSYPTRFFSTMLRRGLTGFPRSMKACFTELGYLTPEGYGGLPGGFAWAQNVTVAQQAAWLAGAARAAAGSGRVRLMIVWNVNFLNWGDDPMAGYAIIRPGGSCPACDALGRVVR